MKLEHVTYVGPKVDDSKLLDQLPADLVALLRQVNGFIQFNGGLHVRGACRAPAWHSLRGAWRGRHAFHCLYPEVRPEDVPFGEDCLGDQFLLREGKVWRLATETGELDPLNVALDGFLHRAQVDPVEYLSLQPLLQFQQEGGRLKPGQLLSAFPPFFTKQSADGVSLAAVPAKERHHFLASVASQIHDVPNRGQIEFKWTD